VLNSLKLTALELFSDESINCLIYSIPIKELFTDYPMIKYRKMDVGNMADFLKNNGIKKLPALLFYKNGKMLGKIEGYFSKEQRKKLAKKIRDLLSALEA